MAFMKNTLDVLVGHVLRICGIKNRSRKLVRRINRSNSISVRTFPLGGDPFDDRTEFLLRDDSLVDPGFRMPKDSTTE